jgi:hypothetical protein
MNSASCPVIPYQKQEDPKSNRMCGAACLAMVYRSLGDSGEEAASAVATPGRKRGRDRRFEKGKAPGGKERRAGRRRTGELTQAEIWPRISKPNRFGSPSSATHLMVADARSRGFAAMAIQARYPLVALLTCQENGIRAILNHRLRPDSPAGHYSVLLDVDADSVVLHDPFYGPRRRIPHAELLELWQPQFANSEIVGNVLIGIAARPAAVSRCPLCETPIPEQIPCPRCSRPVTLQPPDLLGCVGEGNCLGRLWNYVCCPACDNMWNFTMGPSAPPADTGAEDGIWNLGPLFQELDKFREKIQSIPGMASRADVREQFTFIEKSKLQLKLAEKEETALRKEREAKLATMKEEYGKQEAAVEKAREDAAKPPAPADGATLGDSLLKELGITSR